MGPSLYTERGTETFHAVHVECAERVATEAHLAGVEQLVHVSGIGADPASGYPMSATAVNGLSGSCPGGQSRCSLGPPRLATGSAPDRSQTLEMDNSEAAKAR